MAILVGAFVFCFCFLFFALSSKWEDGKIISSPAYLNNRIEIRRALFIRWILALFFLKKNRKEALLMSKSNRRYKATKVDDDEWISTLEASRISGYNRRYLAELARKGLICGYQQEGRFKGLVWRLLRTDVLCYRPALRRSSPRSGGASVASPVGGRRSSAMMVTDGGVHSI